MTEEESDEFDQILENCKVRFQEAVKRYKVLSLEDYTESEEIKKEIQSQVDLINTTFSSPEQVKKFEILPRDFTVDEKELTPTLKLRRKKILQNWNTIINKIYE